MLGVAIMAVALVLAQAVFGNVARGQSAEAPISQDTCLVTDTLSVESAATGYKYLDMTVCLDKTAADITRIARAKTIVVRIKACDNATSPSIAPSRCDFAWSNDVPTSLTLNGSTPAKSGITIEEGEAVESYVLARYLVFSGRRDTSKVRVERVR